MHNQELVVGITPFEEPNAALAVALARAGAVGVLNLGRDTGRARAALGAGAPQGPARRGARVGQTWARDSTAATISSTAPATGTPFFCVPLR